MNGSMNLAMPLEFFSAEDVNIVEKEKNNGIQYGQNTELLQ